MLEPAHSGSLVSISSHLLIQRCHFGSLASAVVGIFTPQKEASSVRRGFWGSKKRKTELVVNIYRPTSVVVSLFYRVRN